MELVKLLEIKIDLVRERSVLKKQLDTRPRKAIAAALERSIDLKNLEIMEVDAQFAEKYGEFKSTKKLDQNGDILPEALNMNERRLLRQMQDLLNNAAQQEDL